MIRFRSAIPEDLEFTYQLKKRTLKEYITETWGWDEEWQWKYHVENFNPEMVKIITENDKDIGCLLVVRVRCLRFSVLMYRHLRPSIRSNLKSRFLMPW